MSEEYKILLGGAKAEDVNHSVRSLCSLTYPLTSRWSMLNLRIKRRSIKKSSAFIIISFLDKWRTNKKKFNKLLMPKHV